MDIRFNGTRYVVSWVHIDDAAETQKFLGSLGQIPDSERTPGRFPRRPERFSGMTICRIHVETDEVRTEGEHAGKKILALQWTGYAFRRTDEPRYDKAQGRKYSFTDAMDHYSKIFRQAAWRAFLTTWPPVKPEMVYWHKRYVRSQAQNLALAAELLDLKTRHDLA